MPHNHSNPSRRACRHTTSQPTTEVTGGGSGGGGGACASDAAYPYGYGGGWATTKAPGFADQGTASSNAVTQAAANTKGGLTFSNFTATTDSRSSGAWAYLYLRNKATSAGAAKVESAGGGDASNGNGRSTVTTFAANAQSNGQGAVAAGCRVSLPGASASTPDEGGCRLQLGPGASSRLALAMALTDGSISTNVTATLESGWGLAGSLKTEARVTTAVTLSSSVWPGAASSPAPSVDLVTEFSKAAQLLPGALGGNGGWGLRFALVGKAGSKDGAVAELLRTAASASQGKAVTSGKKDTVAQGQVRRFCRAAALAARRWHLWPLPHSRPPPLKPAPCPPPCCAFR